MTSKKLPVFIFPEELKIPKTSRKQVLTLYNPYDVSLSFRILSTAPHLYRVVESEGVMKPHCCVDIVVSRLSLEQPSRHEDKFRVDFYQGQQGSKLIGRKQVPVKLVDEDVMVGDLQSAGEEFKGLGGSSTAGDVTNKVMTSTNRTANAFNSSNANSAGPNMLWIAMIGLVSLFILLLPMENESSSWPTWLHVTVSMKLLAAFVLGLVTMVILKY